MSPMAMAMGNGSTPDGEWQRESVKNARIENSSNGTRPKRPRPKVPLTFLLSYFFVVVGIITLQSKLMTNTGNDISGNVYHEHQLSGGIPERSSTFHQQRKSCSQNTYHVLSKLVAKINEDVQANALVPLRINVDDDSNNDNSMVEMPGLWLSSFHGKRIALLGDSTLFWLAKYLTSMLLHQDKVMTTMNYTQFTMGQANNFVQQNKQIMLKGTDAPPPYRRKDDGNTWLQWWGMRGNAHGQTEKLMDDMFRDSEVMKPEVIVANMAFHWTQLCGYSDKMCPTEMDSPIISRWLFYKESWLQRVYDYAVKVDAKLLLFKTANFICGTRRTGTWRTGDDLYQSFDNKTLDDCVERVYPLAKDLALSEEDTRKFCTYGQFTEVGSRFFNGQMDEFVRNMQQRDNEEGGGGSSRLIVGMFNDHDVESCSTTEDAIHHKAGMTVRIRLLANTIDSYLKCRKE